MKIFVIPKNNVPLCLIRVGAFIRINARFHVTVIIQINKSMVHFIIRHNVKFGCSEC